MTPETAGFMTAAGSLGAGVLAAQISGVLSYNWPAKTDELMLRLAALRQAPIGRVRSALGAALLAVVLTSGTFAAYAAEPSAPDKLPSAVIGVMGSGGELSLKLNADGVPRTLKVGQVYEDGWRLQSLTPSEATLTKAGASRRVGLNPTGAIAQPVVVGPGSRVVVAGDGDADILRQLTAAGEIPTPRAGLDQDQTNRMAVYGVRLDRAAAAKRAAQGPAADLTLAEIRAALGPQADDWQALDAQENIAVRAQAAAQFATTGAVSFYVPAGSDRDAIRTLAAAAGITPGEPVSYTIGARDAAGGAVYTRTPVSYVSRTDAATGNLPATGQ